MACCWPRGGEPGTKDVDQSAQAELLGKIHASPLTDEHRGRSLCRSKVLAPIAISLILFSKSHSIVTVAWTVAPSHIKAC